MGLYALPVDKAAGCVSLAYSGATCMQGILGFIKLKQSLNRYVRFGLSSATFSRTPAKLGVAWLLSILAGIALYIACLYLYISASVSSDSDEMRVGKQGVVWFTILGVTMGSLVLGMIVVSRISPYVSSLFIQTPIQPEEDSHD
jgi:hypothetical protein